MRRLTWVAAVGIWLVTCGTSYSQSGFDPRDLFSKPVALKDADGKDLLTGKAEGSPYAADFDGDGVNDLILGAHLSMDTAEGGIWLVRNVGSNQAPRFDWKNAWQVQIDEGTACTLDCGCKQAGYVAVQPVDWNGDGWMDLVYSDTYRRVFLLINKRTSRRQPTFERVKYFDFGKANHAMFAGGGDWNGDGIRDFLYMPYGGENYVLFAGTTVGGHGLKFADGPVDKGRDLKITGERARDCAWAWNFSGTCRPAQIEYVGVEGESREINFYRVTDGVSRKIGVLAVSDGQMPKLTACDLNGDGCMDILYSSGVFEKPEVTKVYVMYGKVKNIKAPRAAGSVPASQAAGR